MGDVAKDVAQETWLDRLVVEERELSERVEKLAHFFMAEICDALPVRDQVLLQQQMIHMRSYQRVLRERLARATVKSN
ncbi:MAG: hypothetical protein KGL39_32030 [Patescibacteria group bacterium]|nr:hypothetical protein [Patescibacteria group bacterium]